MPANSSISAPVAGKRCAPSPATVACSVPTARFPAHRCSSAVPPQPHNPQLAIPPREMAACREASIQGLTIEDDRPTRPSKAQPAIRRPQRPVRASESASGACSEARRCTRGLAWAGIGRFPRGPDAARFLHPVGVCRSRCLVHCQHHVGHEKAGRVGPAVSPNALELAPIGMVINGAWYATPVGMFVRHHSMHHRANQGLVHCPDPGLSGGSSARRQWPRVGPRSPRAGDPAMCSGSKDHPVAAVDRQ